MTRVVTTLGLDGIRGSIVAAECAIMGGLPAFDIVGLPNASVREGIKRVYLPAANAAEAAFAGGVEAIPVHDVTQLLACLAGDIEIEPAAAPDFRSSADSLPDFADLAGSERIAVGHLAEAMSYRNQKKGLEG